MYLKKNYDVHTTITSDAPNLEQLSKYINSLQQDINNLHRELTYWDLYKLSKVVRSEATFASTINELAPGESAIINLDDAVSMTYNNTLYTRGDVIVKLIDNTIQHIKTLNNGIYTPGTAVLEGGVYKIPYSFSAETPSTDSATIVKTIELQNTPSTVVYDKEILLNTSSFTFPLKKFGDHLIRPIVRFYIVDEQNSTKEIIDIPFQLTQGTTEWTVTIQSANWPTVWAQVK